MNDSSSVRELQHALNRLSFAHSALPRLAITGVFDENTLEAVMIFQRDYFPPVTGIVNEETWYAIFHAYQHANAHFGPPAQLRVFPDGTYVTGFGETDHSILIAEALFNALSLITDNFEFTVPSGTNTGQTHINLRSLQSLAGIASNGQLDRITWEHLTRLYHALVVRRKLPISDLL